jgi:oligopeptide/dipeptide ABC transporter ATP-binding protein
VKAPDFRKGYLLRLRNLTVQYLTRDGWLSAVDKMNLDILRGEVLGLVGESGCGKSTLGKALLRMIPPPARMSGEINFSGRDLMRLSESEMRKVRGAQISMIFQDPMTSLNPVQRIDQHIVEAIRVHLPNVSQDMAVKRAQELIERLRIPRDRLTDYPHQLSGGMRQRIMIGLALALKSQLLVADEPTTSLDVIVEAQFLDLLRDLQEEFNLTVILITHNIGIVAELADRVAVMYAGRIVELADVYTLFDNPKHPYTRGLLRSIPNTDLDDFDLYRMSGSPPNLISPPPGCRFHPRCPDAMDICREKTPSFEMIAPRQFTACWLYSMEGS